MISDRTPPARWPRMQKFALSPRGLQAEAAYRDAIVASRSREGRESFDGARTAWAAQFALQPDDGLYLAEVRDRPVNLQQVVAALETCGKRRVDAVAAIERLVDAGFVTPTAPEPRP